VEEAADLSESGTEGWPAAEAELPAGRVVVAAVGWAGAEAEEAEEAGVAVGAAAGAAAAGAEVGEEAEAAAGAEAEVAVEEEAVAAGAEAAAAAEVGEAAEAAAGAEAQPPEPSRRARRPADRLSPRTPKRLRGRPLQAPRRSRRSEA
jgi:hypothetical protein